MRQGGGTGGTAESLTHLGEHHRAQGDGMGACSEIPEGAGVTELGAPGGAEGWEQLWVKEELVEAAKREGVLTRPLLSNGLPGKEKEECQHSQRTVDGTTDKIPPTLSAPGMCFNR